MFFTMTSLICIASVLGINLVVFWKLKKNDFNKHLALVPLFSLIVIAIEVVDWLNK